MDYLERQAEYVIRWASKTEQPLHSEADIKRSLRKATHYTEDDIVLLLAHMKHTGKMVVESISKSGQEDSELVLCKIAGIDGKKVTISVKEKAKFALDANMNKLDQRIESFTSKIQLAD